MYTQRSLHKRYVVLVNAILSSPQPWSIRRRATALLWEYRLGFKRTRNMLLQFMHHLGSVQDNTDTLLNIFVATKFIGHPALSQLSDLVKRLFLKSNREDWSAIESAVLTLLLLSLYQGQDSKSCNSPTSICTLQPHRDTPSLLTSILGNYQSPNQQLLKKHFSAISKSMSVLNPCTQNDSLCISRKASGSTGELLCFSFQPAAFTGNTTSRRSTAVSILQSRGEGLREAVLSSPHNPKGEVLLLGQITCFDDLLTLIKGLNTHQQFAIYNNLSLSLETRKLAKLWVQPNLYLMSWEALVDRFVDQYFGIEIAHEVANRLTDKVLFDLYLANQVVCSQSAIEGDTRASSAFLIQLQELETVHSVVHGYKNHLRHCILHERFSHSVELLDVCVMRGSVFARQQSRKMLPTFYTLVSEGILKKMQQLIITETYRMYAGSCSQRSQGGSPEIELGIGGGIPIIKRCLFYEFENIGPLSCNSALAALFQKRWELPEPMALIEELLRPIPRIWLPFSLKEYAGTIIELFNLGSLLSATREHYPLLLRTLFLYTSTVTGAMTHHTTSSSTDCVETLLFSSDYEFYKPKDTHTSKLSAKSQGLAHQLIQESIGSYISHTASFLEQEQIRRSVANQLEEQTGKLSKSVTLSAISRDNQANIQDEALLPGAVASKREIAAVLNDLKSYFVTEMSKLGLDVKKDEVVDGLNRQFKLLLAKQAPSYADLFEEMETKQNLEELKSEELIPRASLQDSGAVEENISNLKAPEFFVDKKIPGNAAAPFDKSLDTQKLLGEEDLLARKKMEERIEKAKQRDEVHKAAVERDKTLPLRKRKFKTAKEIIENTEYEGVGVFFDWDEYLHDKFPTLVDSLHKSHALASTDSQNEFLISPIHRQDDIDKGWCHFSREKHDTELFLSYSDVNYRQLISQYMGPIQLLHQLTNKIVCNYLLYESNLFSCIDTVGEVCFLLDSNLTNRLLSTFFKHGSSTWIFDGSFQEQRVLSVLSRHDLRGVAELTILTGSLSSADVPGHSRISAEDDLPQQGREAIDSIISMNRTLNSDLSTTLEGQLSDLYTSVCLLCNPHSNSSLPIHSIISARDIANVLQLYSPKRPGSASRKDNGVLDHLLIKENERRISQSYSSNTNFTMLLDFSTSNALFHQLYYAPLEPLILVVFKHILTLSQSLYSLHGLWFLLVVSDKDHKSPGCGASEAQGVQCAVASRYHQLCPHAAPQMSEDALCGQPLRRCPVHCAFLGPGACRGAPSSQARGDRRLRELRPRRSHGPPHHSHQEVVPQGQPEPEEVCRRVSPCGVSQRGPCGGTRAPHRRCSVHSPRRRHRQRHQDQGRAGDHQGRRRSP